MKNEIHYHPKMYKIFENKAHFNSIPTTRETDQNPRSKIFKQNTISLKRDSSNTKNNYKALPKTKNDDEKKILINCQSKNDVLAKTESFHSFNENINTKALSPLKNKFSKKKKKKKNRKDRFKCFFEDYKNVVDKEGLAFELQTTNIEIENKNKEIEKLKETIKKLELKNMGNKMIIEHILDINEEKNNQLEKKNDGNNDNNNNFGNSIKNNSNNRNTSPTSINNDVNSNIFTNCYYSDSNNINSSNENIQNNINSYIYNSTQNNLSSYYNSIQSNKYNNTKYSFSNTSNNFNSLIKSKELIKLIPTLKNEISLCDNMLKEKQNFLDNKKYSKFSLQFLQMNENIKQKNQNLEELIKKTQSLQYSVLEKETQIEYLAINTKKFIDDTQKKNIEAKKNISSIELRKLTVENLIKEKRLCLNKLNELKSIDKNMEDIKKNQCDTIKNIDEEIKKKEETLNEKNSLTEKINSIDKKESLLKKNIEKNNKIISAMKNENTDLQKELNDCLSKQPALILKSQIPEKNRKRIKSLENEIKTIKTEIETMKQQEKDKKELEIQINKLTEELNKKKEYNNEIEENIKNFKIKYSEIIPKEKNEDINTETVENNDEKNKKDKDKCLIY